MIQKHQIVQEVENELGDAVLEQLLAVQAIHESGGSGEHDEQHGECDRRAR